LDTAKRSYMEAIHEGDVMRAFGVGEVVESRSQHFSVGSFATGFTGVQSEAVLDPGLHSCARSTRTLHPLIIT
jgi:NADPH-dependent curcumin reductase CurA